MTVFAEQCTTHQRPFVTMIAEPMHGIAVTYGIGCQLLVYNL